MSLLAPERPAAEPLEAELLIREARRRQRRRQLAVTGLVLAVLGGVAIAARAGLASPRRTPLLSRPYQVPSVASGHGLILHIDWTTTQIGPGHPNWVYEQEVYEETSPPYLERTISKSVLGTPPGTEGTLGMGSGEQTYDPSNNTIYAPPTPAPPPGVRTMTRAQLAQMFKQALDTSQYNVAHLRAQRAAGEAQDAGPATVDGRPAIKITFTGSDEIDYVAAGSY
ncbi:MAG: hypothetical protein FWD04_12415, partial [Conexibacteraceae bacterium]|nr:hypothetical protein [Conexibacteraceae bacterium]